MERDFALPVIAALALTTLLGSRALPAAGDVAKPGTIVSIAGTGAPGYGGDNGPATQALLNGPFGLALDAAGNLYIADTYNYRVRKLSPDGTISTVAGTGKPGFSGDGGKATDAQVKFLGGVVVDGAGDLFIGDFYNHRVRKVTPDGIITTIAGSGPVDAVSTPGDDAKNGGFSGDNGPATDARLNGPVGLAVDARGNLFIADYGNNRVRKLDAVTGVITTVAGNGSPGFSGDGVQATDARLEWAYRAGRGHRRQSLHLGVPWQPGAESDPRWNDHDGLRNRGDLAVDSAGNLFITDTARVRKIDAVTGMITTVAGNGKNQPYAGDGGLATDTGLRDPSGLAIDAAGNLFIEERAFPRAAPYDERILKVIGVAAPGLIAGMPFPMPKQP